METLSSFEKTILWPKITFKIKMDFNDTHLTGKHWIKEIDVYESIELSANAARKKMSDWSNLVFLGHEKRIIDGLTYYEPTFNVWD